MIFFKHKLKKHLPYYRLTRSAKRRLDEIAAALPPRDTGTVDLTPQAEQEVNGGPRHLKQEAPRPIQPMRERPAAVFMRVVVCAVVSIAFIGIFAALMFLRSAAPDILPAASSELAPTATPFISPTPAPPSPYTMTVTWPEIRGGCAFFDVVLNFEDEEYRKAAFYTTELNAEPGTTNTVLMIGGKTAKLDGSPVFYPDGLGGAYRATVSSKMPDSYEGGPIDAQLSLTALYGMSYSGDRNAPIVEPDFVILERCTQSFTLTEAKPWADVIGEANGVSLHNVNYDWETGHFSLTLTYPDLYGFMPSLTIVDPDGETLSPYFIDDKFSNEDGTADITFYYDGLTDDTERLLLHVWFSYFVEQTLDPMTVLAAEYTLFPQEEWFMRSGEYQDLGMAEFDMELITANWRRSVLYYTDHIYVVDLGLHYAKIDLAHPYPVLNLMFDSDLPWMLPLQAEIELETGEMIIIPLDTGQTGQAGNEYNIVTYEIESYERAGLPYRSYQITVYMYDNPLFLKEYEADITIRNRVSGRVIATGKADLRSHTDAVDDSTWNDPPELPTDPGPTPEPQDEPPVESQPQESQPEDGQSSELPPDDSQSSAADDPEQPAESPPPEGETTPEPDDAG